MRPECTPSENSNGNLTSIPGVLTFDLSFFEQVLKRTLSLFSAIPTIVATLSLFVGAVIIANAVALTTLVTALATGLGGAEAVDQQRRREVLHPVGLDRRREHRAAREHHGERRHVGRRGSRTRAE